jgi:hypothetical protein
MMDALALTFVLLGSVALALGAARGLLGVLLNTMSVTAPRSEFTGSTALGHTPTGFNVPHHAIARRDVAALVARQAA